MPDNRLRGISYYVIGGNAGIDQLFHRAGARPRGIEYADVVVFQGGSDISPAWYGATPHSRTKADDLDRDKMEIAIYQSLSKQQWKVGICRGAQLLNVLNGGSMFQDVPGHVGIHEIVYTDQKGNALRYNVSSTHHQMMMLKKAPPYCERWAVANQTRWRELDDGTRYKMTPHHWNDPEIVYFKQTQCLCFQPHPEYIFPRDTAGLFYDCVNRAVES